MSVISGSAPAGFSVTAPGAPFVALDSGTGSAQLSIDTLTKDLAIFGADGQWRGKIANQSATAQTPAATTRTYVVGSNLPVPVHLLQAGANFRWMMTLTKTAAGTATSTFDISVGTAGTTADTARVSFTKPAGTAAADEGTIWINATVRTNGSSGILVGQFTMTHNLSATGHAQIPCVNVSTVSSAFDMTVGALIVGVCITTGASDAVTINVVQSEAWFI